MNSYIKEYKYEDNEIQKVQVVTLDNWQSLDFIKPEISPDALKHLASIYQDYFVAKAPYVFGTMVVFHVPDNIELPFKSNYLDRHIACKNYLKKNYKTIEAQKFMKQLEDLGYLYVVKGKNKFMHNFMPYESIGFLSNINAKLLVNSSFFTFDVFDSDSKYDIYGTPIGLYMKNGVIYNPPLFNREVFLVDKDNKVTIKKLRLKDIDVSIKGEIYERPFYRNTPKSSDYDVVVIGDKIVDICKGGHTRIPSSGFIINTKEKHEIGETVTYSGLENIIFGIECGNSIIIDGKKTEGFVSKFYHLFRPGEILYPPTHYPHDYFKDRAPRIALGQDYNDKPVIIWAEGSSKYKHIKGVDSIGATLNDMANILTDLHIKNAINLDGGGSAQILLDGKRELKISDRDFTNNLESERPVPIALIVQNINQD